MSIIERDSGVGPDSGDLWSAELTKIIEKTYVVTSSDGLMTVTAGGDEILHQASVNDAESDNSPDTLRISRSATEACQKSLLVARQETAKAMANLPGMNPQLRQLLLGESL